MFPMNLADLAPTSEDVTLYDREHFPLYLELIDAIDEGALIDELCADVLHIDPDVDRERAVTCLESHILRARFLEEKDDFKRFMAEYPLC